MSYDGDAHETRRNTTIAIAVAVAAVAMVGLLYWLFSSMSGPALAVTPTAATTSSTTSSATATPPPPSPTTAAAPPAIATWTPTTTFSLPPPEQPTMTAPVDGQTADQPNPATPPPAAPGPAAVSNVNLQCSKSEGKRVTAKLTFDVSGKIDVVLSAGGQVDRKSGGPGTVSMSTAGRGPEICFAKIGDQTVGPVQAS